MAGTSGNSFNGSYRVQFHDLQFFVKQRFLQKMTPQIPHKFVQLHHCVDRRMFCRSCAVINEEFGRAFHWSDWNFVSDGARRPAPEREASGTTCTRAWSDDAATGRTRWSECVKTSSNSRRAQVSRRYSQLHASEVVEFQ